ncbi:hypothetical protein CR513_60885 [Mucuna pruriens]|uniref:NAD-dependent epimerase/dehydratase domain-containing protein n=1 Tax=Mucuna pruriens TaxID=157652 RepID=A0A371E4K7_MUCPR|nr:hypothetical protein CR513_60885 [Mucuna pruriens]
MAEGKGRVCVTGGTGFLGSWIIKRLLEDGYAVNTTIRSDPEGKRDVRFLTNLAGASEKLKIFNADLSEPESFGPAVEGCVGIFHTATPIDFALNEAEEVVTKRTIDGALGILRACVNSKTVKRVVYTSSASTVSFSGAEVNDQVDESVWSDVDFLRRVKPFGWSYAVSKVLAEKAALQFGAQNGLDVVTLIPPFVVGRFVCPKLPDSVHRALLLLFGKKEEIGVIRYHMVHVDDVARAHIFLLEHPNPNGRYNCSPFIVPIEEISRLLSAKYPEYQIPSVDEVKEIKGAKLPHLISKKLVDAGFEFKYSVEDMFEDAIECCKEKEGKGRVCVTGGTGFIGSWIIKRLLEDGYTVNTTIRSDPDGKRDVSFLRNLPGASRKLKIFNADLSKPESFSEAIEGCVGVLHTATPIDLEVKEAEETVTKRSIDGALGILKACLNSKTVKRVVYTSSASAVYWQAKEEDVMDESYWSDDNLLRSLKPFAWSYSISKTLAERAVLDFGQLHGLDVVTLIPTFVVGPFICPKLPGSVYTSLAFLFGQKNPFGASRIHMVHVDDVARAHIFLLEHPNPKGRYNCSPFIATVEEIAQLLSDKYPEFQIPTLDEVKKINGPKLPHLTSKKLVDSGFQFKYSIEEMFEDAIECCKEKGHL